MNTDFNADELRIILAMARCNRARIPNNLIKRTFTWQTQKEGFNTLRGLLVRGAMVMTEDFRVKLSDETSKLAKIGRIRR